MAEPAAATGDKSAVPLRRRSRWRWLGMGLLGGGVFTLAACTGLTKLTTPFDAVINLGANAHHPALVAPPDGRRRLAVALHGVARSCWSMWKIERLLEAHGYPVFAETYFGHGRTLPELGAWLAERLEAELAARGWDDGQPVELFGVAHSMGGLVLRTYAARADARPFRAAVFLGTPNQGAVMAEQLHDTWYYRLILGSAAAAQLAPSNGYIATLGPPPMPLGNVYGGRGDGEGFSASIPGDDDGRVGTAEARLAGEADAIRVPVGHTFLPTEDQALYQVLHFFTHRRFDHREQRQ